MARRGSVRAAGFILVFAFATTSWAPVASGASFVAASSAIDHSESITLTVPTSAGEGDLVVAIISTHSRDGLGTTSPADWPSPLTFDSSPLSNGEYIVQETFVKPWIETDDTTPTWSFPAGSPKGAGALLVYSGIDADGPVAAASNTGSGTTLDLPVVNVPTESSIVVYAYSVANGDTDLVHPTGTDSRVSTVKSKSANGVSLQVVDVLNPASGDTPNRAATIGGRNPSALPFVAHALGFSAVNVQFAEATVTITEAASTQTATTEVVLSAPQGAAVTVPFSVVAGTATATNDYTVSASTITIPAGQTLAEISFSINGDDLVEDTETFSLRLGTITGAAKGSIDTVEITIADDDTEPVEFGDKPLDADGTVIESVPWGDFTAEPGEANVQGTNYLKIRSLSGTTQQKFRFSFTQEAFTGDVDSDFTIPIPGNVEFSFWEDTTPDATRPSEKPFGSWQPSGDGTVDLDFANGHNIIYLRFRVTELPDVLLDQTYTAPYQVTRL